MAEQCFGKIFAISTKVKNYIIYETNFERIIKAKFSNNLFNKKFAINSMSLQSLASKFRLSLRQRKTAFPMSSARAGVEMF